MILDCAYDGQKCTAEYVGFSLEENEYKMGSMILLKFSTALKTSNILNFIINKFYLIFVNVFPMLSSSK